MDGITKYWFVLAVLLGMASMSFAALGLSGTNVQYAYDGSAFTTVRGLTAMNVGSGTVLVSLTSNNVCVKPVFSNGQSTITLGPNGRASIQLQATCAKIPATAKITLAAIQGKVRSAVTRSVAITSTRSS